MKISLKDIIEKRFNDERYFMGQIQNSFSSYVFIGLISFVEQKHDKKFDWKKFDKEIDFNLEINGMQISFNDLIEYLISVFTYSIKEKDKHIKSEAIKLVSDKFRRLSDLADRIENEVRKELNFWEDDR